MWTFLRGLRWSKVKICVTTTIYTHTGGLIRLYIVIWSVLSQFKWPLLFLQHRGRGRRSRLSICPTQPIFTNTETAMLSKHEGASALFRLIINICRHSIFPPHNLHLSTTCCAAFKESASSSFLQPPSVKRVTRARPKYLRQKHGINPSTRFSSSSFSLFLFLPADRKKTESPTPACPESREKCQSYLNRSRAYPVRQNTVFSPPASFLFSKHMYHVHRIVL